MDVNIAAQKVNSDLDATLNLCGGGIWYLYLSPHSEVFQQVLGILLPSFGTKI